MRCCIGIGAWYEVDAVGTLVTAGYRPKATIVAKDEDLANDIKYSVPPGIMHLLHCGWHQDPCERPSAREMMYRILSLSEEGLWDGEVYTSDFSTEKEEAEIKELLISIQDYCEDDKLDKAENCLLALEEAISKLEKKPGRETERWKLANKVVEALRSSQAEGEVSDLISRLRSCCSNDRLDEGE